MSNITQPEQEELRKLFTMKIKPGLSVFQLDTDGNIDKVEFEYRVIEKDGKKQYKKSLITKIGYRYTIALNLKNAKKKFLDRNLENVF